MSIYEEISKKLDELNEKIKPDNVDEWLNDVRRTVNLFLEGDKISQLRKTLECVADELKEDKNKTEQLRKLKGIINNLEKSEPDFLIERIKKVSWNYASKGDLKEAINKSALRLLEQIRLGKRDEVIGILMRIFTTRNIEFPTELLEALKPKYDLNLFRAFMYAFLSAFTTEKSETKEEVENE
ncbi:MAG: Uncharacterized protein XD42_0198 [Thermodesulfobacterium sp. 37_54]|uniref:hypothetical protein n=1 Tax=Thermodesulfobacterium commune TaxID=1741 RepID=UPI000749E2E8|nr:MAG: Uncharacterized protein XD42_0198 [Thermodesulfobacterium sp. 37_54]HBT04351.1 hypothetical protein [Thermodesulfobacterium commune]HCE79407.1 hypothetical protein [Thermodesulfobacterium commune]HCP10215.1 hypothetical protein [Thermodesulfobacterium commune]